MQKYLETSEIINFLHPNIQAVARHLALNCANDKKIAKKCFEFVLDEIHHTGDYKDRLTTTYKASDVLQHKTGWCFAKSHLLAALLRANNIPADFCYQRLSCNEYKKDSYCLHGLNWVFLERDGWFRVDARGNKKGVNARFIPPTEKLAFEPAEGEVDLPERLSKPLDAVIANLQKYKTYGQMVNNFPDI